MTEFVGRTGSKRVYSYPETARGSGPSPSVFARNSAFGPTLLTGIGTASDDTQVPWSSIESSGSGSVHVPITPKVTGIIHITGEVTVQNSSGSQVNIFLRIQVNDVDQGVPANEGFTLDESFSENSGFATFPIDLTIGLPVGTLANISIRLFATTGGVTNITALSSSINIQEVTKATG